MGIGRRKFIQLSSIALAGITIDPLQAVITNEDAYVNKKIGILFYKPEDWGFIQVKDFGALKEKQIVEGGWHINKDEIWDELDDPICIMTKYYEDTPENKGVFSPTITVHATHKSELDDADFDSYEEMMKMSEFGTSLFLKDFKVLKRYEVQQICGCSFYEYDAEYLFEHVDIDKPLKVELKVLKVEHNDFYYDFNFHQSAAQNQTANKEFNTFKENIKLI